jgi:hypothetical protein
MAESRVMVFEQRTLRFSELMESLLKESEISFGSFSGQLEEI